MKVPVKIVFGDMSGVLTASGTIFRSPFNRGLDALLATKAQDSVVAYCDAIFPVQFIPDPSVSHIWMFLMNILNFRHNFLVISFTETDRLLQPTII